MQLLYNRSNQDRRRIKKRSWSATTKANICNKFVFRYTLSDQLQKLDVGLGLGL